MFGKQFSHVCTSNLITSMPSSNCQQDTDSFLVLMGDLSKNISSESDASLARPQFRPSDSSITDKEVDSAVEKLLAKTNTKHDKNKISVNTRTKAEANALFYVLGVLLKKLHSIHKCETCFAILHSKSKLITSQKQRYTAYKAYASSQTNRFGHLHVASETYYNYIVQCENVFMEQFAVTAHHKNVVANIVQQLKLVSLPPVCTSYPQECMLTYFCKLRINYVLKFSNRDFANCKKKMRKLFKIQSI